MHEDKRFCYRQLCIFAPLVIKCSMGSVNDDFSFENTINGSQVNDKNVAAFYGGTGFGYRALEPIL